MAPTQESKPVRYFHIQLGPSDTGQWTPEITVRADVVCEDVQQDNGLIVHLFKVGKIVVAKYLSDRVVGWRVEDRPATD